MKFDDLTTKQKIGILLLVLITLIVLNYFMKNIRDSSNTKKIDYKTATGEQILYSSTEVFDRKIYLSLEQVISEYISSYYQTETKDNYKKYYSMLSKKYKSFLGKGKYEKKAEAFLDKFKHVGEITKQVYMEKDNVLNTVAEYDTNKYICQLKNDLGDIAYIGIELDYKTKNAYIFYLE